MKTYMVELDNGESGECTLTAVSLQDAVTQALDWAADGDWSNAQEQTETKYGGCGDVKVRVWRESPEGEILEEQTERYTIPTLGDLQERELDDGEVLASSEKEFSTESIVRIDGDFYHRHGNGGARGAWDRRCGEGVWRDRPVEPTRQITRQEAIALLLDWGLEPQSAARLTR